MKRKSIYSKEHREMVTLLADFRLHRDMTQEEAAHVIGCDQTYVSAVEVGRRGIDLLQVREFCAAYDVSFTEFAELFEERLKTAASQQRPPRLSPRKRTPAKKTSKVAKASRSGKDKSQSKSK
jgi:transcriptional regulator with XRE-family HTH domain